mmetsp:Transcript_748/g.992  ORF Transcript_748/g.992 Transcript_748/m.992 type:complete len:323 (+) Transcript_748:112-1080(+)
MMSATTLPETDPSSTRNRFSEWVALAVFSAVALGAHESDDDDNNEKEDKWITAVTSMTICVASLSVLAHFLFAERFVAQAPEAIAVLIVAVVWAGGLPVIMNPDNGLGQRDDTVSFDSTNTTDPSFKPEIIVANANLYFSSWGAFIAILYIVGNMAHEANLGTDVLRRAPPKTTLWYTLCAASFVVMVASSRFFHTFCGTDNEDDGSEICKRTKFGICIGVFGTLFTSGLSIMSTMGRPPLMVETGVSFLLIVMYSFGVAYLTFKTGPATAISNFYFSTWAGFVISLLTFGKSVKELFLGEDVTENVSPAPTAPTVTEAPKV